MVNKVSETFSALHKRTSCVHQDVAIPVSRYLFGTTFKGGYGLLSFRLSAWWLERAMNVRTRCVHVNENKRTIRVYLHERPQKSPATHCGINRASWRCLLVGVFNYIALRGCFLRICTSASRVSTRATLRAIASASHDPKRRHTRSREELSVYVS